MLSGINLFHIKKGIITSCLSELGMPGYNDKLVKKIIDDTNVKLTNGDIDSDLLEKKLYGMNKQGWKKVFIKKYQNGYMSQLKDLDFVTNLFRNVLLSNEITSVFAFSLVSEIDLHLFNKEFHIGADGDVSKIELAYVKKLGTVTGSGANKRPIDILLSVHIDFLLDKDEIIIRVQTKDALKTVDGDTTVDYRVGLEIFDKLRDQLEFDFSTLGPDNLIMDKAVTSLHTFLSRTPQEDLDLVAAGEADVEGFSKQLFRNMGYINSEAEFNIKETKDKLEDIKKKVSNIILYSVVLNYDEEKVEEIRNQEYAFIDLFDATGSNKSKIRQKSPYGDPIQTTPEYHSIENAFDTNVNKDYIDKVRILWFSVINDTKYISTKVSSVPGFIRVDFSGYVEEADINNVLCRIRTFF